MKYKNDIANSYIIIHKDRELARAFLNIEPYNKLFVENNVKVIFSEEEEEEDEFTFSDIINQKINEADGPIQKIVLEQMKDSFLSQFKK